MVTVALVGPDGAGKSSVSRRLQTAALPLPVRSVYMGVNLEASTLMLPTTRLAMAIKRSRGRTGDMTMADRTPRGTPAVTGLRSRAAGDVKDLGRLVLWVAEEWFRHAVAAVWVRRGAIVVFDRHFLADYVSTQTGHDRRWPARVHEFLLLRTYPRPDLVICLDAPGAVLHARKGESSPEWLEQRRSHYLRIADLVPNFAVIDATRSLDQVTCDAANLITDFIKETR